METQASAFFFAMSIFDRMTKKGTNKALETAVETAKETLNDKLETYSGIIKIGLTISVIVFGSRKINDHFTKKPLALPQPQQPIVINNYISDGRYNYGRKPVKNNQRH